MVASTPFISRLWGPPRIVVRLERDAKGLGCGVTALLVSPPGAAYLFDPCEPTEMAPVAGGWRFWLWRSASRPRSSPRSDGIWSSWVLREPFSLSPATLS